VWAVRRWCLASSHAWTSAWRWRSGLAW
jgi:hypothetical protein